MSHSSPATLDAIGALVVDSNRMQALLLSSVLRRHAEFQIATCPMDIALFLRPSPPIPRRTPLVPKCFVGQCREYGGSAPLSSLSPLRCLRFCWIQRVARGQIWANTEQLSYLLDLISEIPSLRAVIRFTPREEQVVALVAQGLANREVALELKLSEHTIKKYLFRIFDKLGLSTRGELVLYAVNHGNPRHAEWLMGLGRTLTGT